MSFFRLAWLTPLFLGGSAILLAGFATWLVMEGRLALAPPSAVPPSLSFESTPIEVVIGGNRLAIPRNVMSEETGEENEILLQFLWPDLRGYSPATRHVFEAPPTKNRPVIEVRLSAPGLTYSAAHRLKALYQEQIEVEPTRRAEGGLTLYHAPQPEGALAWQEILGGRDEQDKFALIFCFRVSPASAAPSCRRTLLLNDNLALTYKFKRAYLGDWREMGATLRARIGIMLIED